MLKKFSNDSAQNNNKLPSSEFYYLFKEQAAPLHATYFDDTYEQEAILFLNNYSEKASDHIFGNKLELDIFNANFSEDEILFTIGKMKMENLQELT